MGQLHLPDGQTGPQYIRCCATDPLTGLACTWRSLCAWELCRHLGDDHAGQYASDKWEHLWQHVGVIDSQNAASLKSLRARPNPVLFDNSWTARRPYMDFIYAMQYRERVGVFTPVPSDTVDDWLNTPDVNEGYFNHGPIAYGANTATAAAVIPPAIIVHPPTATVNPRPATANPPPTTGSAAPARVSRRRGQATARPTAANPRPTLHVLQARVQALTDRVAELENDTLARDNNHRSARARSI